MGSTALARGDGDLTTYYADQELANIANQYSPPILDYGEFGKSQQQNNLLVTRFAAAIRDFDRRWGVLPQFDLVYTRRLAEGASGDDVTQLRLRLGLSSKPFYDPALSEKIFAYRRDHGLASGFHADEALIISLNKGHGAHRRVLNVNLQRAKELPVFLGKKFILVDAAKQQLYMFEDGRSVKSMRVIVGKPSDPTPMMAGLIRYSVLNPYWNIPPDLTRDRYAPRVIARGESYLQSAGFEALSDWTSEATILQHDEVNWQAVAKGETELRLRQRPGPGNGMGAIKFMFPNDFGVYLHDTPGKTLFTRESRALSAGCVRVEFPWLLAKWIYGERPVTNTLEPEQNVPLPQPMPVYLTYFTVMPTPFGLDYRDDIYNRDDRTQLLSAKMDSPI